jgi:hypothetical protein
VEHVTGASSQWAEPVQSVNLWINQINVILCFG